MKFFTSDTHFFHKQLLGNDDFAPRPFKNVDEMNEKIISSWNAVVDDHDVVYHLGDIAMHENHDAGFPDILAVLARLNGAIVFIKGNHDSRALFKYLEKNDPWLPSRAKFSFEDVGVLLKFNHHQYYLTHYPMLLGITKNIRNLHGHVHNYSMPIKENINVGIDAPENSLLSKRPPFGTPFSENQIDIVAAAKAEELASLARK